MISQQARELLAREYDEKMPWFAYDIRKGKSKQFDKALEVITRLYDGVV